MQFFRLKLYITTFHVSDHSAAAGHSGNNILNSPLASAAAVATASCTSTAAASSYTAATANHVGPQRLLPYVPKRFVVPRVSAKELLHSKDSRANALGHAQHHHHRALFDTTEHQEEDENNAVTHLGGLQRYIFVMTICVVSSAPLKFPDDIYTNI